ncbi:DUF3445 domain-containing protein [Roseovarius sp.]|uniref:heme-dependent oxidative N-demethylase family protein n=1 Tax=Roseovarius sp. TaxID=1486281 RepID=UPI0026045124|nr:DUF3445 domain-containing protein [Roseovarius sp.]
MTGILQTNLPYDAAAGRPLPGIAPVPLSDWLMVDEAFAAQMRERARLLDEQREDVLAVTPEGAAAAQELLEYVLAWLDAHAPGYAVAADLVTRPDGERVKVDRDDPMGTLGHLVQEDLCVLQKQGDEHVLSAAVLCFPASWRLADKIARPLSTIHVPVPSYDAGIARRVQRLFDGVQVDRPLWRFNALRYADPALHQPRTRVQPSATGGADYPYLRSERQCVLRLPRTQAVVFSIHTFVIDERLQVTGGVASRKTV